MVILDWPNYLINGQKTLGFVDYFHEVRLKSRAPQLNRFLLFK